MHYVICRDGGTFYPPDFDEKMLTKAKELFTDKDADATRAVERIKDCLNKRHLVMYLIVMGKACSSRIFVKPGDDVTKQVRTKVGMGRGSLSLSLARCANLYTKRKKYIYIFALR